jgi:3-oxoadipate enol-lactonase
MQHAINGVQLHWREAGAGDAVVYIHGFPFHSAMWNSQLGAVAPGWRFIAPDLRGFGESEAGKTLFTMDLFADDVVALLDYLHIDQAVICGLSMGGYVALSLINRYPNRVRALVLCATRASADNPEGKKGRLELAARARREGTQPVIVSMLPKLVAGATRIQRPQVFAQVKAMMEATPPETMARALEAMANRRDHTKSLNKIAVSTMIVRGDQDEIIPKGDVELIARTVRGTRHDVIQNVGHLPNLEAPDVFNKTLYQFLNFLPPALKIGNLSLSF